VLCCIFFVLCVPLVTFAQNAAAQADAAYPAKNWSEATKLYSDLQASGQHERAVEAFLQAKDKGVPAALVAYNLACVYASLKRPDDAMADFRKLLRQVLRSPSRWRLTLTCKRFEATLDSRLSLSRSSATSNRANTSRKIANSISGWESGMWCPPLEAALCASRIEKALGGCVIWENWSSLDSTYAGKSYNTWNASLKRWERFWVDNSGGMVHFYGALKESVMDFWTDDIPQPDDTKLRRHLQFFKLGPGIERRRQKRGVWNTTSLTYER
jgi:tetratricopeptide (TPR) repeat protein